MRIETNLKKLKKIFKNYIGNLFHSVFKGLQIEREYKLSYLKKTKKNIPGRLFEPELNRTGLDGRKFDGPRLDGSEFDGSFDEPEYEGSGIDGHGWHLASSILNDPVFRKPSNADDYILNNCHYYFL